MAIRIFCDGAVGAGAGVVGIGDSSSWMWGIINKQEPPAKHSYKKWGNTEKGFSTKWCPPTHWDNHQ